MDNYKKSNDGKIIYPLWGEKKHPNKYLEGYMGIVIHVHLYRWREQE